jgi:mono/diheme cytochrome c family protein
MRTASWLATAALALTFWHAAAAADGAKLFADNCQACHQAGGIGTAGLAPPLVSPVLAKAADKQKDYPVAVVINGLSGPIPLAGGGSLTSAMPPQQALSDEQVAAIVAYVYRLNHAKVAITSGEVAGVRGQSLGNAQLKQMRAGLMP